MKKYFINNIRVPLSEFEKQLRRCCTKGTEKGKHVAAGATCGGFFDRAHYTEIYALLANGWRYTCVYPPRAIKMTFNIKEQKI